MAIARYQLRRGTAAAATSVNEILLEGELGVETDTGKFKIGDGVNAWNDLPYSSGPQGDPGAPGDPGDPGPAGDDGDSAYQVAVNNGFVGTEADWLASLEGPAGPSGSGWDTTLTLAADMDVENTTSVYGVPFTYPVVAGAMYLIEMFGMYTGSDINVDFKWRVRFPTLLSSTHAMGWHQGMNTSATATTQISPTGLSATQWPSVDVSFGTNALSGYYLMQFRLMVKIDAAGDLTFEFANSASGVGRISRLLAGSKMRIARLL